MTTMMSSSGISLTIKNISYCFSNIVLRGCLVRFVFIRYWNKSVCPVIFSFKKISLCSFRISVAFNNSFCVRWLLDFLEISFISSGISCCFRFAKFSSMRITFNRLTGTNISLLFSVTLWLLEYATRIGTILWFSFTRHFATRTSNIFVVGSTKATPNNQVHWLLYYLWCHNLVQLLCLLLKQAPDNCDFHSLVYIQISSLSTSILFLNVHNKTNKYLCCDVLQTGCVLLHLWWFNLLEQSPRGGSSPMVWWHFSWESCHSIHDSVVPLPILR